MRALTIAALALSGSAYADTITTTVTTTTTVELDVLPLQPPGETPPIAPPAATPTFRARVAIGPALGFDTKDKCAKLECGGVHVQIGTQVAPHLLATLGSSIMTVPDDDKGLHNGVHHVETLGLQWWPRSRVWAEAGLGVGSKRSWSYDNTHDIMDLSRADQWAPAGTLAVGYKLWRALSVEARVASTDDVHHTAFAQLLAGVDFF